MAWLVLKYYQILSNMIKYQNIIVIKIRQRAWESSEPGRREKKGKHKGLRFNNARTWRCIRQVRLNCISLSCPVLFYSMNGYQKRLCILGSTGSVGTQTLEVVRNYPDHFKVVCLGANRNTDALKKQILDNIKARLERKSGSLMDGRGSHRTLYVQF